MNKKEESLDFINSLIKDIENNEKINLPDNQNDLNIQMKCEKIQAIFNYFVPYFYHFALNYSYDNYYESTLPLFLLLYFVHYCYYY